MNLLPLILYKQIKKGVVIADKSFQMETLKIGQVLT